MGVTKYGARLLSAPSFHELSHGFVIQVHGVEIDCAVKEVKTQLLFQRFRNGRVAPNRGHPQTADDPPGGSALLLLQRSFPF